MAYQVIVEHRRSEQTMLIQTQTYTGTKHGWLTVDEWTVDLQTGLTAKARDTVVRDTCTQHGWRLLGSDWEKDGDGRLLIQVLPEDWRQVLTHAVHRRSQLKAAYENSDLAWQLLVADTPRKGEPGYVSAIDIARIAEVTRHRIYQIQGFGKSPGKAVINDQPPIEPDLDE